ncbi:TrkH family potassium uptake protein [Pelagibacterium xiamenense]|uniref:TrkH family potassium uptake protein n=1 Tax=Pelagibacterium xiamenense TaxID=2901140 RepID=UPI001E2F5ADD|nr:TrkH family potassium uptake protein [Pelagibacterium xiamenense]MCD7058999.1 TrkH family potassium uptake protein [Pelagibacterium xiamenense]
MDFRTIFSAIGALTAALGASMLLPALADFVYGNEDWLVFLTSALITTIFGGGLWAASTGGTSELSLRQAFLMTTLIWVVLTTFGALPIYLSNLRLTFTDAMFEAMSGITTTGATVITTLDTAPPGILLWRGLLQWFGGLGVVVMAIAVLPMLRVGGMQMFRAEAFETPDKILPQAAQIASAMTVIYVLLTFACAVCYWVAGMPAFDAVAHALSTVATGGFSTRDASLAAFPQPAVHYVSTVFMILGALPFVLYLGVLQGSVVQLVRDSQVRLFLALVGAATVLVALVQIAGNHHEGETAFRQALFSVVSVITGSGFGIADYGAWGPLSMAIFFVIMFIGGCTGSTSCGIKIFRFQVLARDLYQHVRQIVFPSMIYVKRYNGRPLPDNVSTSVQSFVFVYFASFLILAVLLSLSGMAPLEAISGSATALANVGPGLGEIGPAGNFAGLNDTSKWLLTIGMLVGRLEVLVVLVLFTPRFWRA